MDIGLVKHKPLVRNGLRLPVFPERSCNKLNYFGGLGSLRPGCAGMQGSSRPGHPVRGYYQVHEKIRNPLRISDSSPRPSQSQAGSLLPAWDSPSYFLFTLVCHGRAFCPAFPLGIFCPATMSTYRVRNTRLTLRFAIVLIKVFLILVKVPLSAMASSSLTILGVLQTKKESKPGKASGWATNAPSL